MATGIRTGTALRVLVVAEDRGALTLEALIKAQGHQVEVRPRLRAQGAGVGDSPDLVFIDLAQVGDCELKAFHELRVRHPGAIVMAMLESGGLRLVRQVLDLGADGYLPKPFDLTDFEIVLNRAVSRVQARRCNPRPLHPSKAQMDMEREFQRAAEMHAALIPQDHPDLPGFELAALCVPAWDVGGDFYDWQQFDSRLSFVVGDVMGKGVGAALLTAAVRGALRSLSYQFGPCEAVQAAGRTLQSYFEQSGSSCTAFYGQLDGSNSRVQFVDAGHGYVFVRRWDGQVEELRPRSFPLGAIPGAEYREGVVTLDRGDALVLYSDGLVDGWPGRTPDRHTLAAQCEGARCAGEIVDRLSHPVVAGGTPLDDLTVMVLQRLAR